MGGSRGSTTSTTTHTFRPNKMVNPYTTVITDSSGTRADFNDNTWFGDINNYANANAKDLLEEWRNPNLNSTTNQAKINMYNKEMDKNLNNALENNIIAPLSQRNMIRSSQATDLYKGLSKSMADKYDDFINNLLANSQENTGKMIDQLTNWYMQGQNVLNQDIQNSINHANGNATSTTTGNSKAS